MTPEQREAIHADQQRINAEQIALGARENPAKVEPINNAALRYFPNGNGQELADTDVRKFIATSEMVPIELGAFLDTELPDPQPVLGGLLDTGGLMMVHGPAGSGKTFLMLSMGLGASHGTGLLGWTAGKPVPVLFIDGEMAARRLQERLKALSDPIRASIDHPFEAFYLATPDMLEGPIPGIDTDEGQQQILALAVALDVKLVVLDNLSCLTSPEDDNAAASWSKVQTFLLAMRRREIATVVGHHSGKGGQQRGTSRRADILDVVLKLTPVTDGIADGRTRVLVEFEKARSLSDRNAFTAVLEPHANRGLVWTRANSELPVNDRIRTMLIDNMPPSEIATELKTARSFVYRIRTEMLASGELQDGRRSRGQPVTRASVVPLSPSFRRGQGTYAGNSAGDKVGDKQGTQGTDQ